MLRSPFFSLRSFALAALLCTACGPGADLSGDEQVDPFFNEDGTERAATAAYTVDSLKLDLSRALKGRMGKRSGRYLGNPDNMRLWTPAKLTSFYRGISTAQRRFYPQLSVARLARALVSIAAQESTGDYRLNVSTPFSVDDSRSQGLLQVTPSTVVKDFVAFALVVKDAAGKTVLDPAQASSFDLQDPATQVILWAWYTKTCVTFGVSPIEAAHRNEWNVVIGGVGRNFGNAMYAWFAGPRSDRATNPGPFEDYRLRTLDYWAQSGFGTEAAYAAMLELDLGSTPALFRDAY